MKSHALPAALVFSAALSLPLTASAYEFGITGQSRIGCGPGSTCHLDNPGATVSFTGPSTLASGAMGSYSFVIHSTRSDFVRGGLDVSVTGGTLIAPSGQSAVSVMMGELTHNNPIPKSDGAVTVPFDFQAPSGDTCVTLYGAGNATSGNGTIGCAWALASLQVAVGTGTCTGSHTDGGTSSDAGADAADTSDGSIINDTDYSMGYCSVARVGGSGERWPGVALLAGATLSLALRRRRS